MSFFNIKNSNKNKSGMAHWQMRRACKTYVAVKKVCAGRLELKELTERHLKGYVKLFTYRGDCAPSSARSPCCSARPLVRTR